QRAVHDSGDIWQLGGPGPHVIGQQLGTPPAFVAVAAHEDVTCIVHPALHSSGVPRRGHVGSRPPTSSLVRLHPEALSRHMLMLWVPESVDKAAASSHLPLLLTHLR